MRTSNAARMVLMRAGGRLANCEPAILAARFASSKDM
jgi:hypothetical protein